MSDFVLLTPRKPLWGEQCNRCGACCQNHACEIGQAVAGHSPFEACTLLEWDGERYRCGAVRLADTIDDTAGAYLRLRLGIGFGCDSEMTAKDSVARKQEDACR